MSEFNFVAIKNCNGSIFVAELTWSSILQGDGDAENKFLLLFVGMKNGDVVIWKLQLPVLGL